MTNKVQKSLQIPDLPKIKDTDPKGFLIDWNMNIFNIGKKFFFIFTESESFYSIIDEAKYINGSKACGEYLLKLVNDHIIKETNKMLILETNVFSIRKTENKTPRSIMIDMIYHAENCKYKKDLKVFDIINDVPQKSLQWKTSREAFKEKIEQISDNIIIV